VAGIDRQLARLVEGRLQADERKRSAPACARSIPQALADAGLVIEAIVENLRVKQALFSQLETLCGERLHPCQQHVVAVHHQPRRRP
jgi:3-hydroxybutyryl-CoA dehydrogenase